MVISGALLYRKIAGDLEEQIRDGKLRAGDPLPTVSELREQYEVSHITVLRVYQELSNKKLAAKSGRRYLVSAPVEFPGGAETILSGFRMLSFYNFEDNYGNRILYGLLQGCARNNFHFHIPPFAARFNVGSTVGDEYLRMLTGEIRKYGKLSGIALDMRFTDEQIERILLPECPPERIVMVGRWSELPIFSVAPDLERVGRDSARLLYRPEEEHYWVFPLYQQRFNDCDAIQNCLEGWRESGVPENCIRLLSDANLTEERNAELIAETIAFLRSHIGHLTLLIANENWGRILCTALVKAGFVPRRDFRMLSWGGRETCFFREPRIATVVYDAESIGMTAIDLLARHGVEKPGFFPVPHRIELNDTI